MSDGVAEWAAHGLNHWIDNNGVANNLPDLIPVPGSVTYAGGTGGGGEILEGDHIVWSSSVQNVGDAPTPPGLPEPSKTGHLDVLYAVSPSWNGLDNWEDKDAAPLAAGATRVETADGGSDGVNYWIAGPSGDYTLNVLVNGSAPPRITESDYGNNTLAYPFTVYVGSAPVIQPPNITNESLVPDGVVNHPFSFQFASTGTDPETFTYTGTLPTGVVLESTGLLHGTPTVQQTVNFAVTASNPAGIDTTANIQVVIAAASARQPVLIWLDTLGVNNVLGGVQGISVSRLLQAGIDGAVSSMGGMTNPNSLPSWMLSQWDSMNAAFPEGLYVGYNVTDQYNPLPFTNAEADSYYNGVWGPLITLAAAHGLRGISFDLEPYGLDGDNPATNPWQNRTAAVCRYYGSLIGAGCAAAGLRIQVYPSSNASWPGSNNDRIAHIAGYCPGQASCYTNNRCRDFIHGVLDAGMAGNLNLFDASFHANGWYNTDAHTYPEAVQLVVNGNEFEFPGGQTDASVMIWPDDTEAAGHWPHNGSVDYAVDSATATGTGEMIIYQHGITENWGGSDWTQAGGWLDEIASGQV